MLCSVIPWPIPRSPGMQQAVFDHYGIPARYYRLHIRPEELAQSVEFMRNLPFGGWNCTVPHKVAMAGLCDELAPSAETFGSVNTVVNRAGKLVGHNTDGIGWSRAVREAFQVQVNQERILLLGAGGAGRAVAIQALLEGCQHLAVANRDLNRGQELLSEIQGIAGGAQLELVSLGDRSQLHRVLRKSTLVVNATSLGLEAGGASILESSEIPAGIHVFDTVYGKGSEKLREETLKAGAKWSDGLGMLLYQGAEAFTLWTEREAPVDKMKIGLQKEHI